MPIVLVVSMFALAVGAPVFMSWLARRIDERTEASRMWPRVDAVIDKSRAQRAKNSWYIQVGYTYAAQGAHHRSARYGFGSHTAPRAVVEEIVARYPVGATVDAWYDPRKPGYAVLERSGDASTYRWTGYLLGGLFLIVGIVSLVELA